jgi:hypothetical protein
LANLTAGTNITFSSGTTYNGSTAITINGSAAQVYPGAGIANSTGSAWGTSYSTTGSGTVVALATSPTFVTPILGTPTSGTLTNTTGFPAANLAGTALPSAIVTSSLTAVGTIATGVWNGTTIAIANGGTGQTTASAGFNALSPITTTGDLIIGNGTNSATRLAIGANTYVLTSNGTTASWVAPSGGGSPGGSTTQVQYNSSGSFAGSSNMTFNGTTLTLANDASIHGLTVGQGAGSISTNTAVGASALAANTTGSSNVAVGNQALKANTSAAYNIGIGDGALSTNTSGSANTGVGLASLQNNTTGPDNAAFGFASLQNNTTGTRNSAFGGAGLGYDGTGVLGSNTTASDNSAFGNRALKSNTTGASNTAFGSQALLSNTTASNNTAVGYQALYGNTTGSPNTAIGYQAGGGLTTGGGNTFLGYQTGNYGGNVLTTGLYNTYIGNAVYPSSSSASYELVIGSTGSTGGKGSNTGYIVTFNGSTTGNIYQGNNSTLWSVTSDQRLKKNIINNNVGLEKIAQIQVRNFEYRLSDEIIDLPKDQAIIKDGIQLGVIAQEIQAILPECVKTESTGVMTVNSDPIIWYLINAVKELSAELKALKGT